MGVKRNLLTNECDGQVIKIIKINNIKTKKEVCCCGRKIKPEWKICPYCGTETIKERQLIIEKNEML